MASDNSDKKREYRAWAGSLVIHLVIFAIVCLTGLFVVVSPKEDQPVDVSLYDADAGGGHSGGGAAAAAPAPPAPAAPSIDDVVLDKKKEEILPKIEETFTKEPEKQEQFKKEHNAPVAPAAVTAPNGTGEGSGSSLSGTGNGTGNGDGNGNGSGQGTGPGVGSGNGEGPGTGDGNAKRPAIPPSLLEAPEPVYPENLRQRNVKGQVIVRIVVGTDGDVISADVESSSGYGEMDQSALDAAWGYRYTTAYNEYGQAVPFQKRVRITFKLR
ncbi:TonB domain protein [Anaerovibrio sp. JC8]|uniref:energy transducer TonB n=1 Tax=Anaerovibrio sp. JC8 TaxID=1240085 RepID=UPI000A0BF303|nr:energy transducer TonB [Anaerovibrio sp. JC8]ORU00437.1 TonB domain protein [Anaerovibrio sp. JC8]